MHRTLPLLAALLVALTFGAMANAINFTTIDNGDWDDDPANTGNLAIWDTAGLPGSGDTAIINHEIFVDRADNQFYSGYIGYDTTPADVVINAGGSLKAWFGVFNSGAMTLNGGTVAANQRTHVLQPTSLTINDVPGNVWTQFKSQTSKHARIVTPLLLGAGTLDIQLGKAAETAGQLFELNVADTTGFTGVLNVSRLGYDLASPGGFTDRLPSNTETNVAHLKINQNIAMADATFSMVLNEYTYDWTEANGGTAATDDGTAYNGYDMRDANSEVWLTGLTIGGFSVPPRATAYTAAELAAMDGGNVANYLRVDGTDGLLGVVAACTPGDTDNDGDIDTADLTTSITNFTGAGGSTTKTCEEGDTDEDGDVDTADLTYSITNFTGAMAGNAGVPDLVYDPATGNVTIDADGADVISFSLQSGPFNAADFSELPAGLTDNIASQIGWTSFNLFSGLTGTANLGAILPAGLDQAGLEAALQTASYGLALAGGGGGGRLDLIIPEPASMVLMGLGAVALVRRRRAA